MTPIQYAVDEGNLSAVKILLKTFTETTKKDSDGNTLFALAALSGNLKLVKYIKKKLHPKELNPKNKNKKSLVETLLTEKLYPEKYWKIAEYLLSQGVKASRHEISKIRSECTISLKKAKQLNYPHLVKLLSSGLKEQSIFKEPPKKNKSHSSKKEILKPYVRQ